MIPGHPSRVRRFEELAGPLQRQVYFTCLGMMGGREDAEDCAQEAMVRAFRALDSFRGESGFATWLYAIAVRVCLDALRKRRETYSLDLLREEGWDLPDSSADLFLQLEDSERRRLVREAVAQLPPEFRAPLVLVDLQGLPYGEAAEALGVPLGTLKSRVSRARGALLKILSESGELFGPALRPIDERRAE